MFADLMILNPFNARQVQSRINAHAGLNLGIKSGHLSAHVANEAETLEFIKLRGRIFDREYKKKIFSFKSDLDKYDQNANHLIVKDNRTGEVVAGYRVIEAQEESKFYSSSEFNLSKLLEIPGKKIELSKAVIHPNYRDGRTIQIVWKAILAYAEIKNAKYLFGIPSIQTTCKEEAFKIYDWFKEQNLVTGEIAAPHPEYQVGGKIKLNFQNPEDAIPGLLRVYFKSGTRIVSPPAMDPVYKSTDFVVLLDLDNLNEKYKNRVSKVGDKAMS